MRPTAEQLARAVSELGAIPYFPTDSGAQLAVMNQLERFVSGGNELRWLVDAAIAVMREWKGMPELRGLYCTRLKPADGKEENCSLPGFTAEESEMRLELEATHRPPLAEPAAVMALAKQKTIGRAYQQCGECEDTGMRQAANDPQLYEWCVCPGGLRRRTVAPEAIDEANAIVFRLRQRFAPSTEKAALAQVGEQQLAEV